MEPWKPMSPILQMLSRMTIMGVVAWCSVALIVISQSPRLGEEMSWLWLCTGLFGLVSAIGLGEAEKRRMRDQDSIIAQCLRDASTDPLTGVLNRRGFETALECKARIAELRGHPLWLLFIDIDRFKDVNDSYGHQAGDEVLRRVAEAVSTAVRGIDIVARYGGEELAVVIERGIQDNLFEIAERIRRSVATAQCRHREQLISVTASIGLAQRSPQEVLPNFISRADNALYAAKRNGRNCCYVHDGTNCAPVPRVHISQPAAS